MANTTMTTVPCLAPLNLSMSSLHFSTRRDRRSFDSATTVIRESSLSDLDVDLENEEPKMPIVTDLAYTTSMSSLESKESKPPAEVAPLSEVPKRALSVANFRWIVFTVYRRIFTTVFIINAITIVSLIAHARGVPSRFAVSTACSANLMVTILGRQENVVNWLYEIVSCAPHWVPLVFRARLARIFHYGGIHSGCGTAATMWFFLQTILVTVAFPKNPTPMALADLITSWFLILLLFVILLSAYPSFRKGHHDKFEMLHRFSGWSALIIFWTHLFLVAVQEQAADTRASKPNFAVRFFSTPSFWFLLISTSCGLLSWSRMRLRNVTAERLSNHAIRLHFDYRDMPPFYGIKVSDDPLCEWHSFATIPNPGTHKGRGFSILVSNAGDWTSKIINNPPTQLWVRGYPLHGVSYGSRLFKRVVVVCTGTGIGPILSLLQAQKTPVRVLWSTPNPITTFGQKIVDEVLNADPNAVIWNTREHGRPDLIALTSQMVKEFEAEAVYVISNPAVTRKVVLEMNVRGVDTYGVIYDS